MALGIGLRERGYDVLFAVEEPFLPALHDLGFQTHLLPGDSESAVAAYQDRLFGSLDPVAPIRVLIEKDVLPNLRDKVDALGEACRGASLLVSSALQPAAGIIAELTDIQWASVALSPLSVGSRHLPPYPTPASLTGPIASVVTRALLTAGQVTLRRVVDQPINAVRAEYGLAARQDLMTLGGMSREFVAVAASPAFVPRPPDWPARVKLTGFLFWDTPSWSIESNGTENGERLRSFLDAPGDVIAVSSGSMSPYVREAFARFYRNSLAAIQRIGARALVVGAAPGVLPESLPDGVLAVPFAPFSGVYPRCAAVIHHGGIGTTAQGLRAGVPALVVPWGFDQFFDGEQVRRIGAGLWMGRRYYTVERAEHALRSLLHDSSFRLRAQKVAGKIAREDGVSVLCDQLQALAVEGHVVAI